MSDAATVTPKATKPARPQSALKNNYLILYNTVSVVAWLIVFWRALLAYKYKGYAGIHEEVGEFWTWTQTLACMEIVHALIGKLCAPDRSSRSYVAI